MSEPDENPFGDPTVGHPFQVTFRFHMQFTRIAYSSGADRHNSSILKVFCLTEPCTFVQSNYSKVEYGVMC